MRKYFMIFLLTVCFLFIFAVTNEKNTSAGLDQTALDYGFHIDNSYYNISWFTSTNVINVYRSGHFVGSATQKVGLARRNTLVNGKYRDTVLIRFQLEPADTKVSDSWLFGKTYYHGINKEGSMSMTLASDQSYVNYAPDSTYVKLTQSLNFSLGGTVNSKGEFGGTFGIGASTAYTSDGLQILTKMSNGNKTYTTRYLYEPSKAFFSNSGLRARNRWCNSTHKEYAMFQFDAPSEYSSFTITYKVNFWTAESGSANWDGGTWDVHLDSGVTGSKTIKYNK